MDSTVTEYEAEPISNELASWVDAQLIRLQQARLEARSRAALEDVFARRNPYFLRATRKAAWELVQYCLESYLLSVDEILFAEFASEVSAHAARRGQQLPGSIHLLEHASLDNLPLRFELEEEEVRLYNRLTYRFFEELCDEDSRVDWEKLTGFIFQCTAQKEA